MRRKGVQIVDANDQPVILRGIAFGNEIWRSKVPPPQHHGEDDYGRVRAMGMNMVRFYLHAATLEDDDSPGVYKQSGWDWLDRNVAWARKHDIYLILNVHVPPGGFQSLGDGTALWTEPVNQDRLVGLWQAIAARYANEPIIAGYDLLNEPCVLKAKSEWQGLANRLAKAIRRVDPRHILFVERVNAVARVWQMDDDLNFVLVDDANVVYEFHFYDPLTYTHQFAPWVGYGEGGRWPDAGKVGRSEYAPWTAADAAESEPLPSGSVGWTHLSTPPLRNDEELPLVGHMALVGSHLGSGRAFFDELSVIERARSGETTELLRVDLRMLPGWILAAADGHGRARSDPAGHESLGGGALVLEETSGEAQLDGAQLEFPMKPGASYVLAGWARAEGTSARARVALRLERVRPDRPLEGWTPAFLKAELGRCLSWGQRNGVPLFLGEFGLHRPCFLEGRGGETWVRTVLGVLRDRLGRARAAPARAWHRDAGAHAGPRTGSRAPAPHRQQRKAAITLLGNAEAM